MLDFACYNFQYKSVQEICQAFQNQLFLFAQMKLSGVRSSFYSTYTPSEFNDQPQLFTLCVRNSTNIETYAVCRLGLNLVFT